MLKERAAGSVMLWCGVVSVIVTLALYARSLYLPFYSDDPVQLAWLRDLSWGELWSQISPYGYYRPLAFSIWLVWRDLGLPVTPVPLRLFNLMLHALAAALVGLLVVRLDAEKRLSGGLCAAAIFAAFPFSYQAVPWVSAIFYPLVVAMVAGAAVAYLQGDRRARYISPLLAGLAPFAHENGMLAGALVGLVEISDWLRRRSVTGERYPSPLPLIHVALNAIFLIVWFAVRPGGVTTLNLSLSGLWQNLTILITGLTFPLMPLAKLSGLSEAAGGWLFSAVGLALLIWLTRKQWPVALISAGWSLISIGPVLVTMRPDWLLNAPRFLYPAAVGAAIWWGLAISSVGAGLKPAPTWVRHATPALLATGVLAPAAYFVQQGLSWHLRGGQAIHDAVEDAQARPDEPHLWVNLPNDLAPPDGSLYPFFDGGAILLPPQVPATELTGTSRPADLARTVGPILPPVDYFRTTYGSQAAPDEAASLIESGMAVYITDYMVDPIRLRYAGRRLGEAQLDSRPLAYFGDFIVLWDARMEMQDGLLQLTLRWELIAREPGTPTVFVHVVDDKGAIVTQGDGDPIMGLYPFSQFREWIVLEDVRYIRLPGGGLYSIYVGVWDPASGQRLGARGGDYPDDRVPVGMVEN